MATADVSFAIAPLEDRVVVEPEAAAKTTPSGLVIPDSVGDVPRRGVVKAVGPGRFENGARIPMEIELGDLVVYGTFGGQEVEVSGMKYLVLQSRDVLAKITSG